MRATNLARAAASAEVLRIKRLIRRQVFRAVFGAAAVVFLLGALVLLHIVGYNIMVPDLSPLQASAVLLGVDVVIAVIFGILAARGAPDSVEIEAKLVRDQAISEMRSSLAFAALAGPVGRLAVRSVFRRRRRA
jgi:predicted ferric reductase